MDIASTSSSIFNDGVFWAMMGAAFAALFAGIGSAKGVGLVGEAASGLIAEDPNRFGQTVLLQALPGTQGIYGLLIAFIVMLKIGVIGGLQPLTVSQGLYLFAACLPIAFGGLFSGIAQGKTAAAAIGIVAKRPNEVSKGMIFAAMVETYAIFSLLISFLMVNGLKLG
jgi:V/A-type H+-transporting ATPase subunit K